MQDLEGSLAESLPGSGPDTCRASGIGIAALQGQSGDNSDCSDSRKHGDVMPVHLVFERPFADLIEPMKVERDPATVWKYQAVKANA